MPAASGVQNDFPARFDRYDSASVQLDLFCGVRCYVALGMGASQRGAWNCLQCLIIPSEALALGKSGMA
jgi:hypothetical protein